MNDGIVRYGRWAPVSAGEYDRRTRTITINMTVVQMVCERFAQEPARVIAAVVAHEGVHATAGPGGARDDEEARAHAAAVDAAGAAVVGHIDAVLAGSLS